ncbi:hypothetical protein [Niabella drilacis]|uniref:Uncharacterized protein n=1 Tax=Niabella drilacis (strain DSM 25811 / CCM 8410 / CCUG 62505 / LMG 26954 / E90) TaxID=1285928 RepID=A0A1G6Z2A5_NIADE|nr:hypothetical protein [Niabella drilacis]SDD96748.1 hypothetical protein SAMN04487894_11729 [Niabella drilacis]
MLQILLRGIPQLIILAALFYYLVKKRNVLSVILFVSCLASYAISQLQFQKSMSIQQDMGERLRTMQLLGSLSLISYTVFAVAFLILIIDILKPTASGYQFLDDTKQPGNL